ncbi:MAG: hypothetical protein KKC03_13230 [Bacteroidetes bacterium]|nr:hypothetical protein [Bacteroidota bacterium]
MSPLTWFDKHWHKLVLGVVVLILILMGVNVLFNQMDHQKYVEAFQQMQDLHTKNLEAVRAYSMKVQESSYNLHEQVNDLIVDAQTAFGKDLRALDQSLQGQLAQINAKHDATLELQLKEIGHETDSLAGDPDALYREFVRAFGLGAGGTSP